MKNILPSIVIGLGGTGVKTINFLKKTLIEQAPDVAEFVRFLAIDIDELKGEVPSAGLFGLPIRLDPEKNEFYRIVDQTRGAMRKTSVLFQVGSPRKAINIYRSLKAHVSPNPLVVSASSLTMRRLPGVCIGSPTALSPQKFAPAFRV